VKTRNILLSGDLEAKIADFGLMKSFANEFMSHVTTMPAGTLGYLDPE
jgi:serine/threonine protein kinase